MRVAAIFKCNFDHSHRRIRLGRRCRAAGLCVPERGSDRIAAVPGSFRVSPMVGHSEWFRSEHGAATNRQTRFAPTAATQRLQ